MKPFLLPTPTGYVQRVPANQVPFEIKQRMVEGYCSTNNRQENIIKTIQALSGINRSRKMPKTTVVLKQQASDLQTIVDEQDDRIKELKAAILESEEGIKSAKEQYRRMNQILNSGLLSTEDANTCKEELKTIAARIEEAEANLAEYQAFLEDQSWEFSCK
jgi:chromosome segregation ATPase